MKKFTLVPLVGLSLFIAGCGGSDESTQSSQPTADQSNVAAAEKPAATPASPTSPGRSNQSSSGPDIGGLFLGMTPEEVKAAMQAYDPAIKIQDQTQYFEYAALGKRYKTAPFLIGTFGTLPAGGGSLAVGYTYPPNSPRVVAITRIHRQSVKPLTQADYAKALIEKYGQPIQDNNEGSTSAQAVRNLVWKLPGSGDVTCINGVSIGNSALNSFVKDGRKMAEENVTLEYAEQCDAVFKYGLNGDPVTQANGQILDVRAQTRSEFEAREWVQQQINEKSQTGTEAPKL